MWDYRSTSICVYFSPTMMNEIAETIRYHHIVNWWIELLLILPGQPCYHIEMLGRRTFTCNPWNRFNHCNKNTLVKAFRCYLHSRISSWILLLCIMFDWISVRFYTIRFPTRPRFRIDQDKTTITTQNHGKRGYFEIEMLPAVQRRKEELKWFLASAISILQRIWEIIY